MKMYFYLTTILFLILTQTLVAQTTIKGSIIDEFGDPQIGTTISIENTSEGTITDIDGSFELTTSTPTPFTLLISYTGYKTQRFDITESRSDFAITMESFAEELIAATVTGTRSKRTVLDVPASINTWSARAIETSPEIDPTKALGNFAGVTIQQQSASRINIELRGSNGLFGTSTMPIMDYRNLVGAGTGTFQSSAEGISMIDLEQVEVIRGPSSALYGAGVTAGVVHFITKNPIDHPGTTVELLGGELNTFGGNLRHATKVSDKFGFKINAGYTTGDEFTLNPDDPDDAAQIAKIKNQVFLPAITNDVVDLSKPSEVLIENLDEDGDGNPIRPYYRYGHVNTTLEFRPQDKTSVFLSGGLNYVNQIGYNNQGELGIESLGHWIQARAQHKGLFAQVFTNYNNGGTESRPTFVYQTGAASLLARRAVETQVQYNFKIPKLLNADIVAGIDYRGSFSDTRHLVYGRNEDNDYYSIAGAYAQGTVPLLDKLDLTLAGRYDVFNFLDEGFFSPRIGLVYKHNTDNSKLSFRATYNKAGSPPSAINMFGDLPVSAPIPGLFDVWLSGNTRRQTYGDNPMIDLTLPGAPDLPVGTSGLPLAIPHAAVNETVITILEQSGVDQNILNFLRNYTPEGFTGTLNGYNIFDGTPMTPRDNAPIGIQEFDTYEIGMKGFFNNKLNVTLDAYLNKIKGFTAFTALGPTYSLNDATIAEDLSSNVATGLTNYLMELGLPQEQAVATATQIAGAYALAGQEFANEIEPLLPIFGAAEGSVVPQGDGVVHVPAGLRVFADEEISYFGADLGISYFFRDDLIGIFNYSYLSQTEWYAEEDGLSNDFNLNTPDNKFRLGLQYVPEKGLNASLSFQHTPSYNVTYGQFTGATDEQNLVDLGIGYAFNNGLRISVNATNLLDNEYRFAPNFPKIGRRVLGRIIYTFGKTDK